MVYVARDGTIRDGPKPWGVERLKDTFWTFVGAIELFFQTLLPIPISSSSNRSVGFRYSSGSSSSSSSRRGQGPSHNVRGFRTMSDIAPPPTFGGCSGGSCGM